MTIVTILGSPRKKGNTATVLEMVEQLLRPQGHKIEQINIGEYEVQGCLGCQACRKVKDKPGCVQRDDVVAIFERLIAADAVIYATPLYTYCFPAQMKALIDREYCLVTGYGTPEYTSLLQGKSSALLVTCGGPVEQNADLIQKVFEREGEYQQWQIVGKYIVPFCTTPDRLDDRALETAKQMVSDIMVFCHSNI